MAENTEEFSSNALVVISNEYTSTSIGLSKSVASNATNEADDAPRILCNELIVNPHKSKSLEKLDELSSLEREIAKMHHVDEANIDLDEAILSSSHGDQQNQQLQVIGTLTVNAGENDLSNGKNISNLVGGQDPNVHDKIDVITSGETALEHEDLIAVLKGLDGNGDESHNNTGSEEVSLLEEGVTIEGEGEYQIMEVIDDDSNAPEDITTKTEIVVPETITTNQTLNKTKTFGSTVLTAQEERALALEQMEVLKTAHRRRKQDIKPIKQIDPALELVSALEADWSENDEEIANDNLKTEIKPKQSTIKTKTTPISSSASSSKSAGDNKSNSPLITSVVVIPSPVITTATSSTTATTTNPTPVTSKNDNTSAKSSSLKDEVKVTKLSSADGVIETKTEENTQVLSSQTGFRRTRIIKRKIIWDPDAPETTFSYAKLVKPNSNSKTITTSITKGSTTITPIKKETPTTSTQTTAIKKTPRPVTPKSKKATTELSTAKTNTAKSENTASSKPTIEKDVSKTKTKTEELPTKTETPAKLETKTTTTAPSTSTTTTTPTASAATTTTTTPPKRRSQTPVANGPGGSGGAGVKKKKVTEVDRLMGDEGAVNMLNSLEKLEATLGSGDTKSTRPMMRSRAATICEKLPRKETTSPNRTTPPAATAATNQQQQQSSKGKRTPKSRASSSWDYVYKKTKKQEDFDDSLIIRRRSNSSYSSTTSLNRLSLDGPPSSIANDTKSLPASSSENDLSKTPPATSSHNKSSGSLKTRTTLTPPAAGSSKSFEFAKPENKKSQKRTKSPAATLTNDMKKAAPVAGGRRNARSPATTTTKEDNANKDKDAGKTSSTKSPTTNTKDKKDAKDVAAPSTSTISDVVVKKSAKVAQILFSTNKAKLSNTFTIQMLNKLVDILDKLALDPDCHAVVIGTNDAHFCQGIDLTDLTTIASEKRKNYAVNLATSVKNYLKTLATFPKPLIGGVTGNLVNLGVIQLALFDVVIASDKTTFETPYAKMGQVPEGYCIWYHMNKIRGSFKTKLFWLGERIQSTEAALAGLVNKLTAANKVNDDAFAAAKRIASLSAESYRVMKKTAINSHLDVIVSSLDEEFDTIIKQWTSNECLENLKKYLGHD